MLSAFGRAFRTPDLRRKLLFTLGIITIFRLGAFIPSPGVSYQNVQQCLQNGQTSGGIYQLVNLFSGGALLQVSIFALGIMPYITASIIVQLLRVVIPRFQQLYEEGASGQSKLTQYTRYLTIALGLLNATTLVSLARSGQLLPNCQLPIIPDTSIVTTVLIIITLDGRHRPDHVDGRARDGKGRRQRHVPAHLHVHRRRLPRLARCDLEGPGSRHVLPGPDHRPAHRGRSWSSWSSPSAGSRCSTPSG